MHHLSVKGIKKFTLYTFVVYASLLNALQYIVNNQTNSKIIIYLQANEDKKHTATLRAQF